MKTNLIFVSGLTLAIGLLAGCETTPLPPNVEHGPEGTIAYDVLVEASDPGARIEANGEVVGNTPMHLKIFGDKDGTFHNFGSYEFVIRALPLVTNQYPQVRVYRTGGILLPEDHIPKHISFDMNQPPANYPPAAPAAGYPAPYPYPYPYYYGPSFYFGAPYPYYYRYYGAPYYWHHH